MEYALALLVVTTLSSTGLLATWAATSPRTWFTRIAIYLAPTTLVLLIPAVEVFAAFTLQGVVIAVGVAISRRFRYGSSPDRPTRKQYSLLTLLQVTALVAVGTAVATKVPPLNWQAWQSVLLIGIISGVATLLALWVTHGRLIRWWLRLAICMVLTLILSIPLAIWDWFFVSFKDFGTWPPEETNNPLLQSLSEEWTELVWTPTLSAIVVGLLLLFTLVQMLSSGTAAKSSKQMATRFSFIFLGLAILAPPAFTYYKMVAPLPIPATKLPSPNGYDDLISAGELLEGTPIDTGSINYQQATPAQLSQLVASVTEACERGRLGLSRPCMVPVNYTSMKVFNERFDDIMRLRPLADAYLASALLSKNNVDYDNALMLSLDVLQLGFSIRNQGLLIDGILGIARSLNGTKAIYSLRQKLSPELCLNAIEQIKAISTNAETFIDYWHRERIWAQYVNGWHGRLGVLLSDLTGDYGPLLSLEDAKDALLAEQARLHLLVAELALQAYQIENGIYPSTLKQLVPKYLNQIPTDPLDPNNGQLRYQPTEQNYVLYSVGINQTDDGGAIPPKDEYGSLDPTQGDLRLDIEFAPREPDEYDNFLLGR